MPSGAASCRRRAPGGAARRPAGWARGGAGKCARPTPTRREMREEAAGADARIVRDALDDADQHVALAVELRDRATAIAHAGAGADRAAAVRIDEAAVAAGGDEPAPPEA